MGRAVATDYAEMEREFLAGLEADTGRDLAQWMTLIDSQRLAHRNDIIDWLRQQGFQFSWASWLERIHHNGGRPIYGEERTGASPVPPAAVAAPPPRQRIEPTSALPPAELAALLGRAKAYRPLAEHLIREIRRALPDVRLTVRGSTISFGRPAEIAALAVSARELRLGLALDPDADEPGLPRGRLPGTDAAITHVLPLTDARQVTPALLGALRRSGVHADGG